MMFPKMPSASKGAYTALLILPIVFKIYAIGQPRLTTCVAIRFSIMPMPLFFASCAFAESIISSTLTDAGQPATHALQSMQVEMRISKPSVKSSLFSITAFVRLSLPLATIDSSRSSLKVGHTALHAPHLMQREISLE